MLDKNGQPIDHKLNHDNNIRKKTDFLWGMCCGVSADKVLKQSEINLIFDWLSANDSFLVKMEDDEAYLAVKHFRESGKLSGEVLALFSDIIDIYDTPDFFLGLCKGVMGDNILTVEEVECLRKWLEYNQDNIDQFIVDGLFQRIQKILVDGVVDREEEEELKQVLVSLVGSTVSTDDGQVAAYLPIDMPFPQVHFVDHHFCFTGIFSSGSRKECSIMTAESGGIVKSGVSSKIDYLVIGNHASRDWKHESYGTKIQKALYHKQNGKNILIVTEKHWKKELEIWQSSDEYQKYIGSIQL